MRMRGMVRVVMDGRVRVRAGHVRAVRGLGVGAVVRVVVVAVVGVVAMVAVVAMVTVVAVVAIVMSVVMPVSVVRLQECREMGGLEERADARRFPVNNARLKSTVSPK